LSFHAIPIAAYALNRGYHRSSYFLFTAVF
jgi:hypothetical protein